MCKRIITLLAILSVFLPLAALGGDLDSPGEPTDAASESYTLEDVYDRLNEGTAGTKSMFAGPTAGPTAGTGKTLNEVMNKAPVADDTNGAAPEDVKAGKTFWGLTNGAWAKQTGTWPPRFTDNGDGTVTDNKTGLIWLKNANAAGKKTWDEANTFCDNLKNGDYGLTDSSSAGDWRLPTLRELQSLIDYSYSYPALSNAAGSAKWTDGDPFSGWWPPSYYWSSAPYAEDSGYAWYVYFDKGNVNSEMKTSSNYVWPVRDEISD